MAMTDDIRFIDLFSGIGGFRLGLEKANKESWKSMGEQPTGGKDIR
ncbi:hypothetical protein LCGC14_1515690, partial [marine sediment metagenome]